MVIYKEEDSRHCIEKKKFTSAVYVETKVWLVLRTERCIQLLRGEHCASKFLSS